MLRFKANFGKKQQKRYPKIDPRVHPTFDIPVGIFCETYEKARIAKAGNFDVPVGITSKHENIATGNKASNATYTMVWQVLTPYRKGPQEASKAPKRYVLN